MEAPPFLHLRKSHKREASLGDERTKSGGPAFPTPTYLRVKLLNFTLETGLAAQMSFLLP